MSLEALTKQIHEFGQTFDEFKKANDERLKQIEDKGDADPLLVEKVEKIDSRIEEIATKKEELSKDIYKKIDDLETRFNRPGVGRDEPEDNIPEFLGYLRLGREMPEFHKAKMAVAEKWAKYFNPLDCKNDGVQKALSVINDTEGGLLVRPTVYNGIIKNIHETTPMRQLASLFTIGGHEFEAPVDLDLATSGGWVGEKQTRPETDTPSWKLLKIPVQEQYANPKITSKMVQDSTFDIEGWLRDKISEIFSITENQDFVIGDETVKPRGFLTYPDGTGFGQVEQIETEKAGTVTADDFIDLAFTLKGSYATRAQWLINRTSLKTIRKLKYAGSGEYVWQPGLAGNIPNMLVGYPYVEGNDMPTIASGNIVAAFADWKRFYWIVDRMGMVTLRDPYTEKGAILYYTTKRTGGGVALGEAGKLLKVK